MSASHPPLRPSGNARVPAPTGAEAAAFDQAAIDRLGVPQSVLMENAGRAAADILDRLAPFGAVVGLVGSGNNGGDAWVALRTLAARGRRVRAILVSDRPTDDPLLHGWALDTVRDSDLAEGELARILAEADWVIDGLLGTGLSGPPRDRQAAVIRALGTSPARVLALDIPSGVDSATGAAHGDVVQANVTVGFGAPKLGTLLQPGRGYAGRVVAVDIGFPPWSDATSRTWVATPQWALDRLPRRALDTHKNAEGRLLVVAGARGMAGAAVLTVRSAFAAGAGLVRVCTAAENRTIVQSAIPEAIFVDPEDPDALVDALDRSDAVVLGPGLGTGDLARGVGDVVAAKGGQPLLLDADGLNLAAEGVLDLPTMAAHRAVLVTPHEGEAARLLGSSGALGDDRVATLDRLVERTGATVLYKGAPSLVGSAAGPVWIDTQSSSDLAVAGMGDALSGVCGALLARGCPPHEGAALGLYLSGRAAQIAGRGVSLTPTDVLRWIPDALAERSVPESDLALPTVTFDAEPPR